VYAFMLVCSFSGDLWKQLKDGLPLLEEIKLGISLGCATVVIAPVVVYEYNS